MNRRKFVVTSTVAMLVLTGAVAGLGLYSTYGVKASIPGCPVFTLWFNEKTSLLGLVTCTHQEGGATIQKRFTLTGYKPIGGVQLPTRIELARNTQTVEQWEVTSWDFVDKIDDAVFDLPAK